MHNGALDQYRTLNDTLKKNSTRGPVGALGDMDTIVD